jgi:hypothetical protein
MLLTSMLCLGMAHGTFGQSDKKARKTANKDTYDWRYELQCIGTGAQGTYLLKVWSYSKKPDVAIEQAKKNAVHGVLFKGFSGSGAGCTQRPLTNNPNLEQEKDIFFKDFFANGGKYLKFVNLTGDGSVSPADRKKVGKEYKIGVAVSVSKDLLRKDLEDAGILKSLGSGF